MPPPGSEPDLPPDAPLIAPLVAPGELIATANELANHPSKKFRVIRDTGFGPKPAEAFLVRTGDGDLHAYFNSCAHVGIPLDWAPNEFFDETDKLLLCRTHGALYEPATGLCVGGPCTGKSLVRVPIAFSEKGDVRLV